MPISAHRALRTTARGLIAALFLLAFGRAEAQALVKVNDYVNFRLGILLQGQADFQQVANSANNDSGGWQQNMMLRRARFILGGQVAKDVFFYFDTENANLGKSTQTLTSGTTGVKAPTTGFNLLDAVGEWRAAKEFNVQFGEILVPINRWILTSSASTFMLDQSSYNIVPSTALQNNTGRDTGFMFRGYFFNDRLEYRSAFLSGFRQPGVKNAPRFTERLQYNFLDTEVYALPPQALDEAAENRVRDPCHGRQDVRGADGHVADAKGVKHDSDGWSFDGYTWVLRDLCDCGLLGNG